MDTQQANRPVITPAMREQARKQPNSWLYVIDPIFTDPNADVPPWGYIGGYRVDERGGLTDDFSPNPNYRPSPVALRLPAPTNDVERALQLTTTGYAQGQALVLALLDAELTLFAQPQGNGLVTMDHESGRRQLQLFTSERYLPQNWTSWQYLTGRQLAGHNLTGTDLQINPTNPVKARIPAEELVRAAVATQSGPAAITAGSTPAPPANDTGTTGTATNGTATNAPPAHAASPSASSSSDKPGEAADNVAAVDPVSHMAASVSEGTATGSATNTPATNTPADAEPTAGPVTTSSASDAADEYADTTTESTTSTEATSGPVDSDFGRRVLGSFLAGAIGDALGAPVEFYPIDQIRSRFGASGISDYDRDAEHPGAFTDDTQLTLFTLEGLIRGHVARRDGQADNPLSAVQLAYQRWLHTQGYGWQRAAGPFAEAQPEPTGWLIQQRELFAVRAPSSACITALREFAGVGVPGTFDRPINTSEDCGGVVRAAPVALWSTDPREVFELAAATAALTYSHPNGYLPAGVHAVLVHALLHGSNLCEALEQAHALLAAYRNHADTANALRAAEELAWNNPTPENIRDTLGSGWAGHEALAIAVCAALATDTIADAVRTAVNHSGASDSTGALCGHLAGARHAAPELPGVWLRDLRQRELVEKLVADALLEFGHTPPEEDSWYRRYPAQHDIVDPVSGSALPTVDEVADTSGEAPETTGSSAVTDAAAAAANPGTVRETERETADADVTTASNTGAEAVDAADQVAAAAAGVEPGVEPTVHEPVPGSVESRVVGFLLGGAVGDALGYPVEDDDLSGLRRKYGDSGVTDFVDGHRPGGSISDETQLTLFTLEGLIRASIRRRLFGETEPGTQVQHAYQRWLHTQGFDWRDAREPTGADAPDGWLIQHKGLFVRRAPKTTCVQALHNYASGHPRGSFTHRVNESKGSGGVMRAAPVGLWSADPGEVCQVGALTGVLTHGHPSGYLPAGALAVIVQQLLAGRSLPEAVDRALTELSTWDGHEETTTALRHAIELATSETPNPELIEQRLGGGEYGQQALAIAVCAALTHPESFTDAVLLAANHSGASDSTAAICGNIMGAAHTDAAIPRSWCARLEMREVVVELAHDAMHEFGAAPPNDTAWLQRYPVSKSHEFTEDHPAEGHVGTNDDTTSAASSDTVAVQTAPEEPEARDITEPSTSASADQLVPAGARADAAASTDPGADSLAAATRNGSAADDALVVPATAASTAAAPGSAGPDGGALGWSAHEESPGAADQLPGTPFPVTDSVGAPAPTGNTAGEPETAAERDVVENPAESVRKEASAGNTAAATEMAASSTALLSNPGSVDPGSVDPGSANDDEAADSDPADSGMAEQSHNGMSAAARSDAPEEPDVAARPAMGPAEEAPNEEGNTIADEPRQHASRQPAEDKTSSDDESGGSATPDMPTSAAGTQHDDEDHLSAEELRLLTTWRRFREDTSQDSVELTHGLRKLLVEAFGQDRATQLLGEAAEPAEPSALVPTPPAQLDWQERVRGCVLGQAIGDALGAPWSFTALTPLLRENPDGVRQMSEFAGRTGAATRYGQQAVFLLDGLVRADLRSRLRGINAAVPAVVRRTLRHWVRTQGARIAPELTPGELADTEVLWTQRFPDDASLTALTCELSGAAPTPANPPNDARTPAATARGAVVGLVPPSPRQAFVLGADTAVITHGHPDGYLPAAALAGLVAALHQGQDLAEAVEGVLGELDQREGSEPTANGLRAAVDLARRGAVTPESLTQLGTGHHAPESLAIAVAAALAHPASFVDGVALATAHAGDSAATAAICGSLLGSARGASGIPEEWTSAVELREVLDQLVTDFHRMTVEIETDEPVPEWAHRYHPAE